VPLARKSRPRSLSYKGLSMERGWFQSNVSRVAKGPRVAKRVPASEVGGVALAALKIASLSHGSTGERRALVAFVGQRPDLARLRSEPHFRRSRSRPEVIHPPCVGVVDSVRTRAPVHACDIAYSIDAGRSAVGNQRLRAWASASRSTRKALLQ
jgi:hypothetical protein